MTQPTSKKVTQSKVTKSKESKKTDVWSQFETEARRQRRDPQKMLTDYMRECLEIWEDDKLFREMSRQARRSGRKESEAVEIVREVRKAKRAQRAQA